MNQPQRLFDCIEYQLAKFPKKDMLSAKINGSWQLYSTEQVQQAVNNLSVGLLTLGISGNDMSDEGTDKVAIISNNRPEWIITDMAVQQTGAVLVPLYPTTNPQEVQFILNDALVKYIFVSGKEMYEKIKELQPAVPSLKNIYSFDKLEGVSHWTELSSKATPELLQKVETVKATVQPGNLATIIYTSGTTGTPKGVMLTHNNILSNVMLSKASFPFSEQPTYKALSFLPLNHIFEKLISYIYMYNGNSIYYAESLDTIGENLREVKPDTFTTVPRLLEKVFERIMTTGHNLTGIKKKLFFWSVGLAEKYDDMVSGGAVYNFKLAIANKLVFSKWRAALGGNIKLIVTGGAACQEKLLRIFNAAKIPVFEGYGPTENSPVISVNRQAYGEHKFGTVGPPIEGIEVKLAEDGEICVKGPTVMKGYYKQPGLTAETIIDGWLHTGDIGVWVDNKFLKITDRKKELFKTSGGKYVAPQPIENKLKENPFIEQALVVGPERKFVGALIVPSFTFLESWAKHEGINFTSHEDLVNNDTIHKKYQDIIDGINQNFNHVEQVKKFELLPKEWGLDTGEMTPKMSVKRKVVMEKYKAQIERIYS
ncbi:MAG TPA: long-chain fatty acid--CoA ligase [Chitinophagaceae bacterium]|nr:long-chain fatty acid--CoA ligase [Chitinophagaceae bacterium]